jgi:hypothetical protein
MKTRIAGRLLVVLAAMGISGCGQAPQADKPASPAAPSETKQAASARPQGNGPDAAVFDFMEAVRTGNDEVAGKMLTPIARQKVAEKHMVVAPPGTDTARFAIGNVEKIGDDGARVVVKWTDLDEDGKTRTDDIMWMVRLVEEGWRIAGVAAPVFENEPPIVLNFENPEEMLQKQQMVRDEIRRRAEEAKQAESGAKTPADQAAKPENPVRR